VFIPPAIASEIARERHRDFIARADRYRLIRRVTHPSPDASEQDAIAGDRLPHRWHPRRHAT